MVAKWFIPWTLTLCRNHKEGKNQVDTIAVLSFLSKTGMHVKIVQIEFFATEIIIRIHISSLKKVSAKCKNDKKKFLVLLTEKVSFPGSFLPCTNCAPRCSWNSFIRTWFKPNLIIENWFWMQWCAPAKILDFSKIFFY